ncbi:retrovirus-related pol polyprotein from transposon RE1 [Citrus sinensis]|nr:retrovirus-related pol polyprotein from transposon RE1 [Citrus sinensis]
MSKNSDQETSELSSEQLQRHLQPSSYVSNDSPSLQITTHKLNGQNFLQWSQSVKMFIRGKWKIGYLTGSIKEPTEDDPKFQTWDADNSMIMSWLVNSMEQEIGQTYLFLPTAKDLWDVVTETYSDLGNSAQIYDLKTRIRETKQGSQGVTKYYNILKGLWQELDQYYDGEWECAADSAKYKKMLEKERVFEFLAGLSSDLDEVRGRVLGKEPLPSTREVFSYVRREESRKNVMMGGSSAENSALISVTPEAPLVGGIKSLKKSDEKDRVWCDYCHKPRHTRDACWKLHGKPPNLKNNKFSGKHSRGFQVVGENQPTTNTGETESQLFTKEQLEQLYRFLNQSQSLPNPSSFSSLAQKGNNFTTLGVVYEKQDPWIIDSGATDHMTSHSKLFSSYIPCSGSQKIKIADGSLSSVAGKGSIPISTNLVLTYVLHVPNLSCNLLFISKITKDLHCIAKFSPSYLEFQDMCSGKKIGSAREVDGLYYFEEDVSLCGEAQAANNKVTFSIEDEIMLWHLRLDTPQQNGVAERKNRHLLEVARSLMFTNRVPKQFWGEAILTASYLINRMPTRIFNFQSPLNVFTKFYPYAKVFTSLPPKIFGCIAFVHVHKQNRSKLDPRALKCVFLGYSPTRKGYKCYDPLSKKFFVTMDVTFFENRSFLPKTSLQGEDHTQEDHFWELSLPMPIMSCVPPVPSTMPSIVNNEKSLERVPEPELQVYTRRNSKRLNHHSSPHCQDSDPNTGNLELVGNIHSNPISESVLETTNDLDVPIAQRKGTRSCTLHPISKYVSYHRLSPFFRAFTANLSVIAIPKSVQDALSIPEWRDAVYAEMRALEKNKTWELVKLPEGKKPVGCKWIFTVKYRADGSLERYKARLVAKGFTQTYGIDYQETFAPVAKMNSIRVLLSLAASLGWQLQQLDLKNAFLNGELEEEVYMDLPPGFENEYGIEKVCKLKRSLYGLKQSPRAWFDRFTKSVYSFGYLQSQADHTMFFKHFTDGSVVIVIVYVDDIILTGSNVIEMENLKKVLAREFEMKDLGSLRYFLGMEIARSSKGIFVSQRKYTLDLLKETGMLGCKPGDTPIDPYHKLGYAIEGKSVDRESYQRLVGKLIYLSHTRPDIAFAVSVISQFMHSPCKEHLEAVYKVLKYLKKTPGKGLLFKKNNNLQVEVYTDADWAGSVIDRRSTSGYCTFVGGNLVT